jgi:hypothetical protein
MPRFSYFIAPLAERVTEGSSIWRQPVPLSRSAAPQKDGVSVSHGDYFRAARSFLENNSYEAITQAVSRHLGRDVKPQDMEEIRIYLAKHGEFYHPSRIETVVRQTRLSFVLNVAVSESGKRFIEAEYRHLNRLNTDVAFKYLPQVHAIGRVSAGAEITLAMFLGEWFDGYHEFHISIDPADTKPKIMVWDDAHGNFFLAAGQRKTLYAEASKILTCYYNLESFEQIVAWHHAAGDFVVKIEKGKLQLKLITVRQYATIFRKQKEAAESENDPQRIMQALLIFFLNLSIRMRIDRRDGTGEWVWSEKAAVLATFTGFLEALALKPNIPILPDSPLTCFIVYLSSCTEAQLHDLLQAIVNTFNPGAPQRAIAKKNLSHHAQTLYNSIQQLLPTY